MNKVCKFFFVTDKCMGQRASIHHAHFPPNRIGDNG